MKIAVVGAGIAGLSAAHILQQSGASVTVYEQDNRVGTGASGNDTGMVNPRISAEYSPIAAFYVQSFIQAVSLYNTLPDSDWTPCGALHLITDNKRQIRYTKTIQNWQNHLNTLHLVSKKDAQYLSKTPIDYGALLIENSGYISPIKLCHTLSQNLSIHYKKTFDMARRTQYDAVILCCALQTKNYIDLPLTPVRGQITTIETTPELSQLECNLHYGGYISANHNGTHAVGATFQRSTNHTETTTEDDEYNIDKLQQHLPFITARPKVIGHRASIRTTTPDYTPAIGHAQDNIYISAGHGSHGLVTAIGAAHLISDLIYKNPVNYAQETLNTLSPSRF